MNFLSIQLEAMIAALAVVVLMLDAFLPKLNARRLGFFVASAVAGILLYSLQLQPIVEPTWSGMIRMDTLALFFQRLCLLATIFGIFVAANDMGILSSGAPAFYALALLASVGMMLMAAANDFIMLFVALELVTVSFYILTSFERRSRGSLEAGVKYLTLGTLSSSFLLFGIAFMFGATGATSFDAIRDLAPAIKEQNSAFLFGCMMVIAGLGFKVSSVPFQMWAPDVYQGAPTPTAALLATGSKTAGFAALIRLFFTGVFPFCDRWAVPGMLFSAATILYGSLGAVPQQDLKRLMGYVSIASAGFLLMGLSACNSLGLGALLFYLTQNIVTLFSIFLVITAMQRATGSCSFEGLAGLHRRSPILALALFLGVMSLAGVPPLSGALGKFFLFASVVERAATDPRYYALVAVGGVAVVISLSYSLGVLRAAFVEPSETEAPIEISLSLRLTLLACMAAIVLLGLFPAPLLHVALQTVGSFNLP